LNEEGFKQWLGTQSFTEKSIATRLGAVRRTERALPELGISQPDLDAAFDYDSMESVRAALQKLKLNAEQGGQDYRIILPDSETPIPRLENFIAWLGNYRDFKNGLSKSEETAADRIRQFVLDNYIAPARADKRRHVSVKVREVHEALALSQAWANVCQAISGSKFQKLANVAPPDRDGAEASPATTFIFDLDAPPFSMESVERELARRFGEPIKSAQKILAFRLADGKEIALDRDRPPAQLWIEASNAVPARFQPTSYAANKSRHSGLPTRLSHSPGSGELPQPVAMVRVSSMSEMAELLDWYGKGSAILNREELDLYKRLFLARYPDFEPAGFAATEGGYFSEERSYKNVLIDFTRQALVDCTGEDDSVLGAKLLDVVTGKAGAPSNLLGWRTDDHIKALRSQHSSALERQVGILARADDESAAINRFVEAVWPILAEGQPSKPYSESRNIPTMLSALIHPASAYGINTDPFSKLALALTGERIFGNTPLTRKEYAGVLLLAESIFEIMANEWRWSPRDLWDVQGFVWAVHRPDQPKLSDVSMELDLMAHPVRPTNLILYGPPGTGKTFATAKEAVELCTGSAPDDRHELMKKYADLAASGRIEFVTFHQSYSYEEFVEGLRPHQGDEGAVGADGQSLQKPEINQSAGFRLIPEPGLFRRIARRAETSTGSGSSAIKVGDRQVFKMSIGEVANPDDAHLFEEALEGSYALLGFGTIDWSDERFEKREAFIEAWKQASPEEPAPNASNGRVQCPYIFRNWVKDGDLIIVSKGNSLFRAIGVVTGDYEYAPAERDNYYHRRAVQWLWHDRLGVPVEEIYARGFSMRSIYQLTHEDLNIPALERYMASQQSAEGRAPEPFVLIIDEINRANISKVFGELITLIEPDKRIDAINELKVRLPYSREMFGVPQNLHIIGTMNTADRSIALLDTALRRRFEFRELQPNPSLLSEASDSCGINLVNMLRAFNERIEYLFDREHQLGHAYFIDCKSKEDIDAVMRHKIIPLLAEYFYEDWTKVAIVLGDASGEGHFVERTLLKAPAGLDVDAESEPRYRWSIKAAFGETPYDQFQ
jgi:5-methylcytosine-specific restriction protein B